jgi:long-chain acyl-CoA synthetase
MALCSLSYSFGCNLYCNCIRSNLVSCDRITNAVTASGMLKERLFRAAYNSKKQAIMSGMCAKI